VKKVRLSQPSLNNTGHDLCVFEAPRLLKLGLVLHGAGGRLGFQGMVTDRQTGSVVMHVMNTIAGRMGCEWIGGPLMRFVAAGTIWNRRCDSRWILVASLETACSY
jgi:hypothetical protein